MNLEMAMRLIELRRKHGLSQEALAEKLGVSRQAVSKWERVESAPDTDNLIALAKLYGITIDELLNVDVKNYYKDYNEKNVGNSESSSNNYQSQDDSDDVFDDEKYAKDSGVHYNSNKETVHISSKGIHISDKTSGDKVHISWKGVNVHEEKSGNNVHIGLDGIHVNNGQDITGIFDGIGFLLCAMAYLIMGFVLHIWHPTWLIFFLSPVIPCLIKPSRIMGVFPVLVTGIYLLLGFQYALWHPAWIIFLTIPVFYTITNGIKAIIMANKSKSN